MLAPALAPLMRPLVTVWAGLAAGAAIAGPSAQVVGETHLLPGGLAGVPSVSIGDRLGAAVATLGDLDGDGFEEIALGAPGSDIQGRDRGAVWIRFGGSNPSAVAIAAGTGGFTGNLFDGDRFGSALAGVGDLDGDGVPDLAVGQPGRTDTTGGWPMSAGVDVGGVLPFNFESSGCAWHPGLERLLVVDDGGALAVLTANGQLDGFFQVGGDLEGICVPDPQSPIVYVGREEPAQIVPFNVQTGAFAGPTWDVSAFMNGNGQGLEALAWVDGVVYAGLQRTGEIFRFDLGPGGTVQLLGVLPPVAGRDDISGLHYSPESGLLYGAYDPDDLLVEFTLLGQVRRTRLLPGLDQEGVAIVPHCPAPGGRIYVAEDQGPVRRYEAFPAGCDTTGELAGRGTVWILLMNTDGTVRESVRLANGAGGVPAGLDPGDGFGSALSFAGDLDGNGFPELFVGAPGDDGNGGVWSQRGAVWSLSLLPTGLVSAAVRLAPGALGIPGALADLSAFGASLSCPGDWDGNGVGDLLVGAPGASGGGAVRGELWGLSLSGPFSALGAERIFDAQGGGPALGDLAGFGLSLAALPQAIGGDPGVAIGAATAGGGSVWLAGMLADGTLGATQLVAAGVGGFVGPTGSGDAFGAAAAGALDTDGDGLDELLVGAPGDGAFAAGGGSAWLLELEAPGPGTASCFGDGPCPCGNSGAAPGGCGTSTGPLALVASGTASIGSDDLVLSVDGAPLQQFGLIFLGPALQGPVVLGDGLRCVGAPLLRLPVGSTGASGSLSQGPGLVSLAGTIFPPPNPLALGSTWHFQAWFRDPGGPCGSGSAVSSALSIQFAP